MFLSASNRNRGHCIGNAVEGTMMADEPARVLPPHLAIPKWCERHNRRYYKNKQDAHGCDTFLTLTYMDKLDSLVDLVCVCPCLWLLVSCGRAQFFFWFLVAAHISFFGAFLGVCGLERTDYCCDVRQEGWESRLSMVITR